jgi:hypothetical protein
MGYSGTFRFDGSQWTEWDAAGAPGGDAPWLVIDVHDSAFATITYHPQGTGSGVAQLGRPPADVTTDVPREAKGLTDWLTTLRGDPGEHERRELERVITAYLADREPAEQAGSGDQTDEGEVYAEVKASRLLVALGLPVPDQLVR